MDATEAKVRLGGAIRTSRAELGLSQERLALLAGLHRNYIGDVERGERNPSLENVLKIVDALGCTAEELFGRAGL